MGKSFHTSGLARRKTVRVGLVAVAGLLLLTALYFVATNPPTDSSYYPKCLSYQITSIHCPGCGSTRALHALLNLQFEQAVAYNVVMVALLPLGIFVFLRSLWHRAQGTTPDRLPGFVWFPRILTVVLIAFWILRNIPVYPLTLLAPHELTP
jgi:Protein of unknown function (DUF2752)